MKVSCLTEFKISSGSTPVSAKAKMPSKQAPSAGDMLVQVQVPSAVDEVRAVEELVSSIKENLRLKSKSSLKPCARRTPYHIPCRSWNDDVSAKGSHKQHEGCPARDAVAAADDPYELLQVLIKSNSLVQEAVRRLQHGLSPKQRYFYESDEDTLSPVLRICHLEL